MFRFLRKFVGNSSHRPRPARRVRLEVESLEQRTVPTAGISKVGFAIIVNATNSGDKVVISRNDNGTPANHFDDSIKVQWTRGDTGTVQTQEFKEYVYVVSGDKLQLGLNVNEIAFHGGAGADKVWNNTNLRSTQYGMSGNDELHGGSNADLIEGGLGSDKIYGGDGPDVLEANGPSQGGDGPAWAIDYVYGQKGPDILHGGYNETNFLFGGDGDLDRLKGGDAATNYLYGGGGNDVLRGGGAGAVNFLYGGAGNDWMIGGSGEIGKPKVFNQMIDNKGKDTFIGGDRASNVMNAVDGGGLSQQDVVVPGVINSQDLISVDFDDVVWDIGPYPVPPPG